MNRLFRISLLACLCASFSGCATAERADRRTQATDDNYSSILAEAANGEHSTDARDDQSRPLVITAILHGSASQLQQLLDRGYPVTAQYMGVSAIHFTVTEECLDEKLAVIIAAGAEISQTDDVLGATALHFAAQHQDTSCLEKILEAGADVNARDKQGRTAYFYALDESSAAAVSALWDAGADPEIPSADGLDLFKYAIASEKADLVKPLVFKLLGG